MPEVVDIKSSILKSWACPPKVWALVKSSDVREILIAGPMDGSLRSIEKALQVICLTTWSVEKSIFEVAMRECCPWARASTDLRGTRTSLESREFRKELFLGVGFADKWY